MSLHFTLPARYYTDPAQYAREMERFFFRRWIYVGREEAIAKPGDYFLRDVAGESVIVTRDSAGSARAFYNVCRHRGTQLCAESQGSFGSRIRCPYHAWTYSLDGALLGAPHMDPSFDKSEYPLRSVYADTWDGLIFLNFDSTPAPLADQLGTLPGKFANWRMGELRLGKRIIYDVKANWKLIVSNFNECLHCPSVHPALNKLTNYLGADNEPPTDNYIGGVMDFRPGIETMTFDGVRRRSYHPGLTDAERQMVAYYAIYPNLLLSLHPDYAVVYTLWPHAVDRTEIVCEFLFQPGETVMDDAVEFWDVTNLQDWKISELSQAGISSRAYTPGPYSYREELLWGFDKIVVAE